MTYPPYPQNAASAAFGQSSVPFDPCTYQDTTAGGFVQQSEHGSVDINKHLIVRFSPEHAPTVPIIRDRAIEDVRFPRPDIRDQLQQAGVSRIRQMLPGFRAFAHNQEGTLIKLPEDLSLFYSIEVASALPRRALDGLIDQRILSDVQDNMIYERTASSLDPKYQHQWWLHNGGQLPGTGPAFGGIDVEAEAAWDISKGLERSIPVAVLDGGVMSSHPDINVVGGATFVGGDTEDTNGHGTEVAGVIGANGDNGLLGAGLNWGVQIVPVRVEFSIGGAKTENIAKGIQWMVDNGISIGNISLAKTEGGDDHFLGAALRNANATGTLITASMGNTTESIRMTPALYSDLVLSVGAVYADGNRWTNDLVNQGWGCTYPAGTGSNTGYWIDLSAPGGKNFATTTINGELFHSLDDLEELGEADHCMSQFGGTSAAAPVAAGVASLVKALRPQYGAEDIEGILKNSATKLSWMGSEEWTEEAGYGLVSAFGALNYLEGRIYQRGESTNLSVVSGPTAKTIWLSGHPFIDAGGWFVDEYVLETTISFASPFDVVPDVWVRASQSLGWHQGNRSPHYAFPDGFGEIVEGSMTPVGCRIRTYFYYFKARVTGGGLDEWKRWQPGQLSEAKIAWTAMGPSTVGAPERSFPHTRLVCRVSKNPVEAYAHFALESAVGGEVGIEIFDVRGSLLRRLVIPEGRLGLRWDLTSNDGSRVSKGVYFYRATAEELQAVGRVVVLD